MRKIMKVLLAWMCVASMLVTAFAHSGRTDSSGGHRDNKNKSGLGSYHYHCGGYPAHLHTNGYCPYKDVFPTSVKVSAEKNTLGIGEQVTISATVSPSNACNSSVSWTSSDTSVVKVTNGMIKAVGYGTATITASSFNGKTGSVKITVKEITAEKVSITDNREDSAIYIGESLTLTAAITPENVDNPSITWASSDEQVATVDSSGNVQAFAAGNVTITATASNGVKGKYTFKVLEKYMESVEILEGEQVELYLGSDFALSAKVAPEDATFPEITWTSSDETVAAVSGEGFVTAVGCGTAIVTATSSNGLTDEITVEVLEIIAEQIDIEGEHQILIGSDMTLSAVFYPTDTTIQTVTWSSSDDSIASIDVHGHVNAINVGAVTITATGKDVQTDFVLEVLPIGVESIEVSLSTDENLNPGDTASLSAVVSPSNATYPEITWTSSNPKVITVDDSGTLEAKSIGTAIITASSADGCTAEYEASVVPTMQTIVATFGAIAVGAAGGMKIFKSRKKHGPIE